MENLTEEEQIAIEGVVGRENEGEIRSYDRGGSHTADEHNYFIRGRGTRNLNEGRGRQDFQRGRGSSYNRMEEE